MYSVLTPHISNHCSHIKSLFTYQINDVDNLLELLTPFKSLSFDSNHNIASIDSVLD